MLTTSKLRNLQNAVKEYHRKYLKNAPAELDESGTRLMVNHFLIEVLGFAPIEEVKTEYMIRGTYADYVIQLKGKRHFLVEVKALGFNLADKHLRQAVNYGANEGIDWALLTNGRQFDFYRIIFGKPIDSKRVLSIDLSDTSKLKDNVEGLQFLHKSAIENKGLDTLWNRCTALDPVQIAGLLLNKTVVNFVKRSLKIKYKYKFTDDDATNAIRKMICSPVDIEAIKAMKLSTPKKPTSSKVKTKMLIESGEIIEQKHEPDNSFSTQN